MIRKSFTLRVLVASFLLLALPLLIDSFIFFQQSYYAAIQDAKRELKQIVDFRNLAIVSSAPVRENFLKEVIYLFNLNQLQKLESQKLAAELTRLIPAKQEIHVFVVAIEQGDRYTIVASNEEANKTIHYAYNAQLREVLTKKHNTFIRYVYSETQGHYIPYLYMADVILDQTIGKPIGILIFATNVENQLNKMLEVVTKPHVIEFAIANADGIIFASTDERLEGQLLSPITEKRRKEIVASGDFGDLTMAQQPLPIVTEEDPAFFEFNFNNNLQIAYKTEIPDVGMTLFGYSTKKEFFGDAVGQFLLLYTIYGLILVIGGGIAYWLASWISRPLSQLSHVMVEVSQGDLNQRFKKARLGFEINILGSIFNNTIDTLLENIQQAEDERVKKETYQRELKIARQVQRSLLPAQTPHLEQGEVAGVYLPAQEVGGDLYGYLKKSISGGEEVLILSIADVAGQGISSCLYSLSTYSLFRAYATLYDDVGEILRRTNNDFIKDAGDTGMFVTVFMGMYHILSRRFEYYSCGHVPALVRRKDGSILTLSPAGIALGLKEAQEPYHTEVIQLNEGDIVLIYTDGLIEAVNEKHQFYSKKRLEDLLQSQQWSSAQSIVDAVRNDFSTFTHATQQEEEVIIVALKA